MNNATWNYPPTSPVDEKWGLMAYTIGTQSVGPGEEYPPKNNIAKYLFNPGKGRIIAEYQLIYLTKGKGTFSCYTLGNKKKIPVSAGDVIMLFPGEWHTYEPDPETGWEEHWIDFVGGIPDFWLKEGLISKSNPIFHVGFHKELIDLYTQGLSILEKQDASYQQALCGICANLICKVVFYNRNHSFEDLNTSDMITRARICIDANLRTITPEQMAKEVGVGYSKFRKDFKAYTGIAPASYINDVRISKAKELLTNTQMSIKEISYECGFASCDYFSSAFRKKTGLTASEYRRMTK